MSTLDDGASVPADSPDVRAVDQVSAAAHVPVQWWAAASACAIGAALAAPEWLPHAWTKEDGPVEFATFGCFLVGSIVAVVAARSHRAERPVEVACLALGALLFIAAGEEISWGQRQLDVETPSVLVDGNRQDELNLHNLEGLQDKAVVAQLAIASIGLALPRFVRRPWARAGVPCFAGYLAYRAGRGLASLFGVGAAGRNAEAAELLLALGLLVLVYRLARAGSPAGPTTAWPSWRHRLELRQLPAGGDHAGVTRLRTVSWRRPRGPEPTTKRERRGGRGPR